MITDPLDDVADSTDWLSTPLSGLAAVEAALRCQVCKDFYKTPMLTSCNHTFCSVCIRRALSNDGKCPLCRASEQELKLRSNWSMEETVEAFVKSRRHVLDFAKRPPPTSATDSPKRKLDHVDGEEEVSGSQRSNKRLRSSTRLSKSRGADATAEMARQEADVQDTYNDAESYEPDDGLVACPVCLQRMKENQVFQHLDTSCPGEPQAKPTTRQSSRNNYNTFPAKTNPPPPKSLERLPAINYSMLKEPQLRRKLQEFGISTAGNRQMLEKRHKEWMTIWNANCDSLHPRRKAELLHDLEVWERTLGTRAPTSSRSIHLGAQIKDKDFDGAAWAAKHDTSFKDLIANARKNRPKTQEQTTGPDKGPPGKTAEGERPPEILPATRVEMPNSSTADHPDRAIVDLTDGPGSHILQAPNGVVDTSFLGTPTEIPQQHEMAQQ
ncbi:hypothetical protein DL762_010113 [Monosporascus cannonballus]|uniref:Postreplication repair E3 ubiquitin-protein ligase RAD18 n=1 Tax=Monosporascus cannonballus TaxID=155416 RepID=A0ABY0GS97_9PEZI|nr:hypothetical protein DL762_010113 [Monosporascus cannonballus]RYO89960.1 hypothetical protein DL763_005516 [Monosporascus cannonballus]